MDVVVIGAGDVVCNRYLKAMAAIHPDRQLRIADVVDVRSPEAVLADLESIGAPPRIHQLHSPSPTHLIQLLEEQGLSNSPIIVATPSQFHVPYANALLRHGFSTAIEKPLAASREHVEQFDEAVNKAGTDHLFLLGYYALEKGLGGFVLGLGGEAPTEYLRQLTPALMPQEIGDLRKQLGSPRQIRGVLMEGQGTAGQLDHRAWVLDPSSGGNTVETFYHLACMTMPFLGNRQVSIDQVALACHRDTEQWYRDRTGCEAAETLTTASLSVDGDIAIRLACAKYVPDDLHERWMEIEFDHGQAFMDFEENSLKVKASGLDFCIKLRNEVKYATQFALFSEKLRNPQMRVEYKSFREALLLTLDIRDRGVRQPSCATEELDRDWLDQQLSIS